jgi:hypothetical protein
MKTKLLSNLSKVLFTFAAIAVTVSACKKDDIEEDDEIPESNTTPYN